MSSTKHVVELNGKKYDAVTGKQITSAAAKTAATKTVKAPKAIAGPRVMDGIVSKSKHAADLTKRPQPSKTLMRNVVKKPVTIKKEISRTAKPTAIAAKSKAQVKAEFPEIIKMEHVMHAANVKRSGLISKFGKPESHVKAAILPVKEAPQHTPPAASHVDAAKASAVPATATAKMVAAGLAKATSHAQPKLQRPSLMHRTARKLHVGPRALALTSTSLIALALIGFVAYHKMPSVAMKVAATRAGFSASLPTYQPAGFSLKNPIDYNPGQVSLQYTSNSDTRNFKVVQRASAWNSEALLDNVVASKAKEYQTYQANGRTIYIYDGNNATWVDGGVWYQIEGNSNLSSDQLLKIANSL